LPLYENFHSSAPSHHSSHNPTTQSSYIVLINARHGPHSHHCYRALYWRKQRCCFVLPVPLPRRQPLLRYCKSSCVTSHSSLTCSQLWYFQDNQVNDCTRMCLKASGDHTTAGQCNAGGKWSKVSSWNAQGRAQCQPPFIF
jgi:hypothetical protein